MVMWWCGFFVCLFYLFNWVFCVCLFCFVLVILLFFNIMHVCYKSLTLPELNNPDGSHDLMIFLIMSLGFTLFSKI